MSRDRAVTRNHTIQGCLLPKQPPITVHAFTSLASNRVNVLESTAGLTIAFNPSNPPSNPPPQPTEYKAIWDTGATNSVITNKVVAELSLQPISIVRVKHGGGESDRPVYLVNIVLPNKVVFYEVRVTEGDIHGDYEVLIGMDIIGAGDFAVTNKDNKTMFSFRFPPIEHIDFVKQRPGGKTESRPKPVFNNDPCSCGSGVKYRNCCKKKYK